MTSRRQNLFSAGQRAALAMLLEATAPKPGNVHRGADFEDVNYLDFAVAGIACQTALEQAAAGQPVGQTVLAAVEAMRSAVASNTSLGMILLLAPLATIGDDEPWQSGVERVLAGLTPADARDVYEAIRRARPGGLGQVETADVAGNPPDDLLFAMQLAAERDLVARQYVNGFDQVLHHVVPNLARAAAAGWPWADGITDAFLRLLADFPDSLIARKCGPEVAVRASAWAARIVDAAEPGQAEYHQAVADFDFWLRSDGHRRNPGTSADLLAAGLYVALSDGIINWPLKFYG